MKYILTLFICFITLLGFSQISAAQLQQARVELEKRGISEAEMRTKLLEKGIDIDKVDPSNPVELQRVQTAVEEVLKEIEAEKQTESENVNNTNTSNVKKTEGNPQNNNAQSNSGEITETTENIKDAVKEGASLEEALSEELSESKQEQSSPAKIYGQQLFRNQSLKLFRTTNDAKPPDSYILGTGDEVSVSIFGISQADFTFEIPQSGFIKPAGMPRILLKGISYGQAKKLLRNRFGAAYVFQPEQFAVTITTARTITVNIFGEVNTFGSFTISALNTAFNALVAAGGPSNIGSVRNIQVISNGQSKRLDVYQFMADPSVQFDFSLANNDIINVPVAQRVVKIEGAIRRPFRYELIEGENLNQLIKYAGGLTDNALRNNIQIIRFEDDREVIIDINLNELQKNKQDFNLLAGDVVSIKSIARPYENFVTLEGEVENSGKFQLETGMRITDLLAKGVLREEARIDIAFLKRTDTDQTSRLIRLNLSEVINNPNSSNNLSLQPKDKLIIYSQSRFIDQPNISVRGAVRQPIDTFNIVPGQTIKVVEAITLAGGITDNATDFAYLIRRDSLNPNLQEYIRIDLAQALNNPNSDSNITLEPYDRLNIPNKSLYTDTYSVNVAGAVRQPGEFKYSSSLTLRDLLTLAGGLKKEASTTRIDIFRVELKENQPTQSVVATVSVDENLELVGTGALQLQPFDYVVVREVPDFELQQNITIEGEIRYPGVYALLGDNERLSSVLERAGGFTGEAFPAGVTLFRAEENTGFIVTQVDEIMKNPRSRFNYVLKAGDIITIPKKKDLVTINIGNTEAAELYPDRLIGSGKINIAYEEGKNAKWYINKYAAGIAVTGTSNYISVEHPNGRIEDTKNYLLFKDYPEVRAGSVISVGTKPIKPEDEEKKEREPIDWEKIVSNSIAQVSALLTLLVLSQQLGN